jgi:hypothetical protein
MANPRKAFKPPKKRPRDPLHDGSLKAAALRRLKAAWQVENSESEWEPEKEPSIKSIFECAEGGTSSVLDALRAYSNDEAQEFIRLYDSATERDQKIIPIEAFAFASGVGSVRLAGLAAEALVSQGHTQTQILMGSAMHKVMRSTIKAATDQLPIVADDQIVGYTNGDTRAQEMFHKMTGMMPIPKGSQIAIQNVYKGAEKDEVEQAGGGWRGPDERLREIYEVVDAKQLEAPKADTFITGRGSVEFDHVGR